MGLPYDDRETSMSSLIFEWLRKNEGIRSRSPAAAEVERVQES